MQENSLAREGKFLFFECVRCSRSAKYGDLSLSFMIHDRRWMDGWVDGHGHRRVRFFLFLLLSLDIYWLVWNFSYDAVRDTYGVGYVGGDEDGR